MLASLLARARQAIEFARRFPLTAPIVAAADTALRVLRGNLTAFLAEPWVVAAAIASTVDQTANGGSLGWKAWLGSYALAACRWFTSPVHEQPV